ncbi:CDP-glucose 4,6-dehydratase [Mucilaginibacter antarcticus]|uniref:CDP-glucose 4,6-dehydratase n=1 Tax=Mucilaginibacter antarcticus TaxID=1855725 RepID=A0ABW5XPF7_9SPHI
MLQNLSAYKGKKVFLTGHTGFKGSWLLKILNILGADVKGYALAPKTEDDIYNLIDGENICTSVIADLRDREKLLQEIADFRPDFIFHLAAQPLVRLSYEIPAETFDINVMGTANVLDAVRLLDKQCTVVLITTDKVYQNNEWVFPYRENDRLGGYDPYSASKACAELLINSYKLSFFNHKDYDSHKKAIAVARAGNVIGGGDWSQDRLIPDIIKALVSKESIIVRNPASVRPWQHVLEPVVGYLILGLKLKDDFKKYGTAYNFGPNATDTLSVGNLVDLAIDVWGEGTVTQFVGNNQPHEAGLLKLDITKAGTELNWHPKMNAEKAVNSTINWYKEYYTNKQNIVEYTTKQILDFLNLN